MNVKKITLTALAAAVFSATAFAVAEKSSIKPVETVVGESFVNPIGYSLDDLTFSWKLPPARQGVAQTAFRIRVATSAKALSNPDVWDSGKIQSSKSVAIPYAGRAIKSGEKMYWQVKVWDEKGSEGLWSDINTFEAGLLENSDWQAKWISVDFAPSVQRKPYSRVKKEHGKLLDYYAPPYMRKNFTLEAKKIEKARLYVSSKGIYEMYINGKKVGNDHWSPGWTDYKKRIQTYTYDVSDMLSSGKPNTLAGSVGDGWYAGRLVWLNTKFVYGTRTELLAQLEITYTDGTKEIVATDKSWKAAEGGIIFSDIYDGEDFDARKEPHGWTSPNFDDSQWKNVIAKPVEAMPILNPHKEQPIVVKDTLYPLSVKEISPGTYVFDMGQNMVGWMRITIPAQEGKKIVIRCAEMLNDDGTLYLENYRTARSEAHYTCATNGTESWEPKFTYFGFRYVELSGLPSGLALPNNTVVGKVLFNDMELTGSFVCSEPKVNILQSNIQWGQRGNFFSTPTDCPQRDERLGWTGDAQVFIPTAAFNMDVHAFFTKWTLDIRDDQDEDGGIPCVIPDVLQNKRNSAAWADASVICPWETYMAYGNPKIIRDNYETMKKWIAYMKNESNGTLIRADKGYGDWLEPVVGDRRMITNDARRGSAPRPLIGTAYFVRCCDIVSKVAKILGKNDEAELYSNLGKDVRKAFIKEFVDTQTGEIKSDHQTVYLLALAFDILPEDLRPKAFAKLKAALARADNHLGTGFVGTPLLNPTLSRFGDWKTAYELLKKETYPSWLYPINQGATTMWERWNSYTKADGFGAASMNSFNHYAYGAIGQWMYKSVAGIWYDEENPGYKNIIYAPQIDPTMRYASASHKTPYGQASSAWKISDGVLEWTVVVPPNATGSLTFPTEKLDSIRLNGHPLKEKKSSISVPSGTYEILLRL